MDLPAVVAPAPSSTPVCVSCLGRLQNIEENRCPKCNLPVCSQKCQESIIHKPGNVHHCLLKQMAQAPQYVVKVDF